MSISIRTRYLIATGCLALSACTETITREVTVQADPLTPESTVVEPSVNGVPLVPVEPVPGTDANTVTDTGTTDPDTTTGVATPGTSLPDAQTPVVVIPVVTNPMVTTPVVSTPAVTIPTATNPMVTTPAVTTPVVTTPAVTTPVVTTPAVTTPVVTTPAVTTPVVTTPAVTTPVVTTPAVTTPVVTTPAVTTPVVTTPAVTTPVVTTPAVTTPVVTTPAVTTPVVTSPVITDPADISTTPLTPVGTPLLDPETNTTVGVPGVEVDCEQTLPCSWLSDDLQFSLSVTNADNIATLSRLSINYSILTAHDTQVFVSRAENAQDANGTLFRAADQSLGGGNGGTPQGVVAGSSIQGTLNFDAGSTSDSISQWSIAILDGGLLRVAKFANLPVGTVTSAKADCQNTLPCTWTTPSNDVAITLLSVGGISIGSRLTANFSVETTVNTGVAVDAGSTAFGSEGTVFEGRTHTIVSETNFEKVTATAIAGLSLFGSVNFFRTESVPTSLQQISLIIYPDQPVPRWNPQFLNVPVQ